MMLVSLKIAFKDLAIADHVENGHNNNSNKKTLIHFDTQQELPFREIIGTRGAKRANNGMPTLFGGETEARSFVAANIIFSIYETV
jgi:hypothetical protein